MSREQLASVKDYYGRVLKSKADLRTTACCAAESLPEHVRPIAKDLHEEVVARFYGCGVPLPPALEGLTVLDLGCGSGRDVYLLSKLVGPKGRVIGLDMTEEQLEVARRHQEYHRERFGYPESNVRFVQGYMEDLAGAGIEAESVDLVVSNCVFNLSPDKERLFAEIFRVLKPGGELYFSDVFCDRRLPAELRNDPVLLGECLAGALYVEDQRRIFAKVGCQDHRVVSRSPIEITDAEIRRKIGNARFTSITLRCFKLDLEDRCEDYGQVAYYRGGIEESPHAFTLDDHHLFEKDRPVPVCSNTAAMLEKTRFAPYFEVRGNTDTHFGLFDCGPSPAVGAAPATSGGGCC